MTYAIIAIYITGIILAYKQLRKTSLLNEHKWIDIYMSANLSLIWPILLILCLIGRIITGKPPKWL